MKIAVLGASGHVGRSVVRALLAYESNVVWQVVLLNRRVVYGQGTLPEGDVRLQSYVVNMSSADTLTQACAELLKDVDAVVSTIGVGSGRGPAALFRFVEVELPSAFARAARDNGVQRASVQFFLTGVGSDASASTSSTMVGGAADGEVLSLQGAHREAIRQNSRFRVA